MTTFQHDPNEVLDYYIDWTAELTDSDTIETATVTADPGVTVSTVTHNDKVVTAWISGGVVNTSYRVTCEIVTVGGRTEVRSFSLRVEDR